MPVEMLVPIVIFFGLAVGLGLVISGEAMKNIEK
jgi:hypothetical protein